MDRKKLPTVNIKGKEYVLVKDRVIAFNQNYPNGCIQTEIVSDLSSQTMVVKATVIPDVTNGDRRFIDYSQATIGQGMVNTTSALENASTSATGRALAMMGIGVIESIASADEVRKAINLTKRAYTKDDLDTPAPSGTPNTYPSANSGTENQDKCEYCGSTSKYHSKTCPNFGK